MVVLTSLKEICFGRYLWITNTVTGGLFLVVGDGIQQSIEKYKGLRRKNEPFDTDRSGAPFLKTSLINASHLVHKTIIFLSLTAIRSNDDRRFSFRIAASHLVHLPGQSSTRQIATDRSQEDHR